MGKVKYPNPKFFKAKDRMDWAAQAENLKLVGGIFWDMFKETDWKKFGEGWKNILISDRDRIKEEYKAFAAASMKDKIDLILNGERHLGRLYRDGAMCTVRREWRGIKDTVYDFYEWARLWGMLLMSFSKDLIPAMNQTLYYRWMVSYFCCHSFMDKNILGLRGSNLRMSHELTYCIYRYVAENLVILAKGDRRNGNSEELNSKLVLIDGECAQRRRGQLRNRLIVNADHADIARHQHANRIERLQHANRNHIGSYDHGIRQHAIMVAHELLPQRTAVAHGEQAVGIHQSVGLNTETPCLTTEICGAILLIDLIKVHQAALASDESNALHALGSTGRDRIMHGLLQIRLHGIEQIRRRIHVNEHAIRHGPMQPLQVFLADLVGADRHEPVEFGTASDHIVEIVEHRHFHALLFRIAFER